LIPLGVHILDQAPSVQDAIKRLDIPSTDPGRFLFLFPHEWISVHERTGEIGLLRALGVSAGAVRRLFLLEATALAVAGGIAGVAIGFAVEGILGTAVPGLPLATPPEAVLAALAMSLLVGIAAGVIPARRAAALDPVDALRAE
jgi:putative ABC transport system permease protein